MAPGVICEGFRQYQLCHRFFIEKLKCHNFSSVTMGGMSWDIRDRNRLHSFCYRHEIDYQDVYESTSYQTFISNEIL